MDLYISETTGCLIILLTGFYCIYRLGCSSERRQDGDQLAEDLEATKRRE
jgi:hypothetical protein